MSLTDTIHSSDWTPIGQTSTQLVLYHAPSNALQVQPRAPVASTGKASYLLGYQPDSASTTSIRGEEVEPEGARCPYCSQPIADAQPMPSDPFASPSTSAAPTPYFQILEKAHESSRPSSPASKRASKPSHLRFSRADTEASETDDDELGSSKGAEGYYDRFFQEECRLGIGAEGSVFLAKHVIGGNVLGSYAVKKVAVGTSKAYLLKMLHEVRLLETLRHPHIIPYHHSWIDVTRFSSFGPPILALHILMMYATAGNLDTFIQARCSASPATAALNTDGDSFAQLSKAERIKAYKRRRASLASDGGSAHAAAGEQRGVILLSKEEIGKLFGDVVDGLAYLHSNSILHLDLKCSNVLLHWEEGKLIPKAMISDFGTSEEMLRGKRERTGHTGTMEYMAPETVVPDSTGHFRPYDSLADIWSLGMILHKLLFFRLPYVDTESFEDLLAQIIAYPGFIPTKLQGASCERRHIPANFLVLLAKLLHVTPAARPSAEKIKLGLQSLMMEEVPAPSTFALGGVIAKIAKPVLGSRLREQVNQAAAADDAGPPLVSPMPPLLEPPPQPHTPAEQAVDRVTDIFQRAYGQLPPEQWSLAILFVKIMSLFASNLHTSMTFLLAVAAFAEYVAPTTLEATAAFACFHLGLLASFSGNK